MPVFLLNNRAHPYYPEHMTAIVYEGYLLFTYPIK